MEDLSCADVNLDEMVPQTTAETTLINTDVALPEKSELPSDGGNSLKAVRKPCTGGRGHNFQMNRRQILKCSSWFEEPDGMAVKMTFCRIAGRKEKEKNNFKESEATD